MGTSVEPSANKTSKRFPMDELSERVVFCRVVTISIIVGGFLVATVASIWLLFHFR
jgi:hypothetical protein